MPDEIYGVMAVKNGQKQTIMNLSNARQKSYADLQTMTDAQKKGVIVCPDYPKEEFLVTADEVSYGSGTVKDALDERTSFIDTNSSAIASITTIGGSWTATQDCWAVARARKESASSANPQIFLGSITMMNVNGLDYAFVVFPVMKGQTVSTRNTPSVVYNIEFYPTV